MRLAALTVPRCTFFHVADAIFSVLPLVALLFLCSFLDRTNKGNAKIIGLENDIHISPSQYRNGLPIYYACYIASKFPSNLIIKKLSHKILGFFGAVLGIFESGLFPGIVLYLSSMYTGGELAVRIGVFYTGGSLSGAFGGLLARGLSGIGPRGQLEGWRWIFIIEGIITAIVAVTSYIYLPNSLQEAPFLSTQEQHRAFEREELFEWSEVLRGIFNVQNWLNSTSYFAIISGLYSFGLSLAVANAGGFVTTFVCPDSERPYYHSGHTAIFRLLCYAWDLANVFWYAKTNHDKARGKYNEYTGSGNDRDPKFKLLLLMVIPSDDESSPSAFSFCIKTDKG
ncbi:hypothetical protein NHJ6243_008417 [Beauveria neobassiana]